MNRLWFVLFGILFCTDVELFKTVNEATEKGVAKARASTKPNLGTTDAFIHAVIEYFFFKSGKCDARKRENSMMQRLQIEHSTCTGDL